MKTTKCGKDDCTQPECQFIPGFLKANNPFYEQPSLAVNASNARKAQPVWAGCFAYFPRALLAVSEHSRKANEKHNPGEPLHWSKDKSKDHADCAGRHLLDIGPDWGSIDPEFGSLHATALAWRALALLETVLERDAV